MRLNMEKDSPNQSFTISHTLIGRLIPIKLEGFNFISINHLMSSSQLLNTNYFSKRFNTKQLMVLLMNY